MFAGVVASSYPKVVGPVSYGSFGPPDGGTRRSYNGATDQYVDNPGWAAWVAGGPKAALVSAGWTLQFQVEASNLEAGGPPTTAHIYRLRIAGVSQNVGAANPVASALPSAGIVVSGNDVESIYAAPSGGQTVSGTITFGDYEVANTGNTMHQGIITLRYRYTRT